MTSTPQYSYPLIFLTTAAEGLLAAAILINQPSEIESQWVLGFSAKMLIVILAQLGFAGMFATLGFRLHDGVLQKKISRLLRTRWILAISILFNIIGAICILILFWLPPDIADLRPQITRMAPFIAWCGIAAMQIATCTIVYHLKLQPLPKFVTQYLLLAGFGLLYLPTVYITWRQPAKIGDIFRTQLILPLLWGNIILLLANSFPGKKRALTVYLSVLTLFLLPLISLWASGYSHPSAFLGLFPFSDAQGYYSDARKLIVGLPFSDFSGRRPLFPGFLASILFLNGQNLPSAVLILTILIATACYLAGAQLKQTDGPLAASLLVTLLFFFIRFFIGTTLTETLGVIWGCLGFILLWRNFTTPNLFNLFSGMLCLTFALDTRAGPFFVLPFIVLVLPFSRKQKFFKSIPVILASSLAIIIGLTLNNAIAKILSPDALPFSNSLHSFYGVVTGGKGWLQIFVDHPELKYISDKEFAAGAYPAVIEAFRSNPMNLVTGILKTYQDFFSLGRVGAFSFINGTRKEIAQIFQGTLFLISLVGLWRMYKRPQGTDLLVAANLLGVFCSIPFLPPSDAYFMRVQAAVIPISLIIPIRGIHQVSEWIGYRPEKTSASCPPHPISQSLLINLAALIFSTLIIVPPLLMRNAIQPIAPSASHCRSQELSFLVHVSPANTIRIWKDQEIDEDWSPQLKRSTFTKNLHDFMYTNIVVSIDRVIPPPVAISNTISLVEGEPLWLVDNQHLLDQRDGIIEVCGYWLKPPWERGGPIIAPAIDASVFYVTQTP